MLDHDASDVTIWTSHDRVAQVDQVLRLMGPLVRPVGVGGPRLASIDALARRLGCPHEDDLRKLLVDRPAKFVLLASTAGIARQDVLAVMATGATIIVMEPIASELDQLLDSRPRAGTDPRTEGAIGSSPAIWMPAFDRSPGWTSAADPDQVLGRPQLISIDSFGQPGECTLFARMFDAWRTVLTLADLPDLIDASLTGPLGEVPENLRGVTGHLGAHARFASGCTAVLRISDSAGTHHRTLGWVSGAGYLHVSDTGYRLHNAQGACIDQSPQMNQALGFAQLVAVQWKGLIDRVHTPSTATARPATDDAVLGCCQACLLSARTGHPESPRKLLQLYRRGSPR